MKILQFRGGDQLGDALLFAFPFWAITMAQYLRLAIRRDGTDQRAPWGLGQDAGDVMQNYLRCDRCDPTALLIVQAVSRIVARREDRRGSTARALSKLAKLCADFNPEDDDRRYWARVANAFDAAADAVYYFVTLRDQMDAG